MLVPSISTVASQPSNAQHTHAVMVRHSERFDIKPPSSHNVASDNAKIKIDKHTSHLNHCPTNPAQHLHPQDHATALSLDHFHHLQLRHHQLP